MISNLKKTATNQNAKPSQALIKKRKFMQRREERKLYETNFVSQKFLLEIVIFPMTQTLFGFNIFGQVLISGKVKLKIFIRGIDDRFIKSNIGFMFGKLYQFISVMISTMNRVYYKHSTLNLKKMQKTERDLGKREFE